MNYARLPIEIGEKDKKLITDFMSREYFAIQIGPWSSVDPLPNGESHLFEAAFWSRESHKHYAVFYNIRRQVWVYEQIRHLVLIEGEKGVFKDISSTKRPC